MNADRIARIENIIDNMETLNNLWWKSEEDGDKEALKEHNELEKQIRDDMKEIGLDFDKLGAEYEDMIDKLKNLLRAMKDE